MIENYKKIIIIYDPKKDIALVDGLTGNTGEILEIIKNKLNKLRNEALSNTINS